MTIWSERLVVKRYEAVLFYLVHTNYNFSTEPYEFDLSYLKLLFDIV